MNKYSLVPAICYCIPVLIFLRDSSFSMTWLLYLGNALFLAGIFIMAIVHSRQSTASVPYNGFTVTIIGIILSCIIIGLLLIFFYPAHTTKLPASSGEGAGSLLFMLFANALIGNFVAGTFATVLAGSTVKSGK